MKSIVLVLAIAAALVFAFGCAGPQISAVSGEPAKNATPAPAQEEETAAPPSAPPAPPAEETNETTAPPEEMIGVDSCTVEFQKDPQGVYYVMVKTESLKELFVRCPNYKLGEKRGSLYFCESLDTGEPVVAYLDLKECGRAYFDRANQETASAISAIGCTVSLAPSRIVAGQTSVVTIWTSSGGKSITLEYNCGEKVETEKREGTVSNSKICQFNSPGTTYVYANVDGTLCASRLLEVFATAKDCSVYGSRLERAGKDYVYTAKVAGRGYSGGDQMVYNCYNTTYIRKLSDVVSTPPDFVTTIECRGSWLLFEPVSVKVGGNSCGSLEVALNESG